MTIREYIKKNFKNCDINTIKDSIDNSIKENNEETLPGLGVFFEILWNNSSCDDRNSYANLLYTKLK